MLIHSVTPAYLLTEQPELPQYTTRSTGFGYLEGFDTPQGFCVSRLHSTDPSLYLRAEYAPGSVMSSPSGGGTPAQNK